jgi:hypothetical protein
MEIKTSYLVKLENGKQAWLSVDKEVPSGATIIEERPMLIPAQGMVLHKKGTDIYSLSTWLRGSTIEEWEEITQEAYDEIIKEQEEKDDDSE